MPHRADDRGRRVKYGSRHYLLVECPQILHAAAAAPDYHHIRAAYIQRADSPHYRLRRPCPLHLRRTEDQLHIGIAALCYLCDIPYGCSRRGCHHSHGTHISRDRLLILRSEQSHILQLLLELQKTLIQLAPSRLLYLHRIQAVCAAPGIDLYAARRVYRLSVLQSKRKTAPPARKHDSRNGLSPCVLQCKIDMSCAVVFAVADLAPYRDPRERRVMHEYTL